MRRSSAFQRTSYDTFEGQNLDDGSIKFYLRHQDCCTFRLLPEAPFSEFSSLRGDGTRLTPPFEGGIIEGRRWRPGKVSAGCVD